ncbi:ABC transporter ATP-binding protein [Lentzea sp. NBRC 105346]|uniref:ATP-binding cassette domain-containing protein n=1 Tax=Lentzea sp. NBRC 105346 TaxID=3032205 RepID=UPI0024A388B0|nr:ATP-binding cassette domain-containing protein [Lentzea sp. NBRC 105346]GLZ35674.1 ABC transporter ATP-binding protein [Lentzea sp. NBRC 105346]
MTVRVENVSKWALHHCSFELPAGSVTALVGANGAGKTTLLNILAGHLPADFGHVAVAGRVAFVPQDKPMYKGFTPLDVLKFGGHMNKVWDEYRAHSWLHRYRVPLKLRCGDLSGGQRAHVAFALALGSRPDVLLLDEPLAELDPLARRKVVRDLLAEVADTGMTLLYSTHVVAELGGVADRLLLLSDGKLLVDGDTDELLGEHLEIVGPAADEPPVAGEVVLARHQQRQSSFVVRCPESAVVEEPWTARPVTLEELVVAHLEAAA